MERSILLGEKEYKYEVSFKLSYDFLKYRNRIEKGFDFSNADKDVVQEIVDAQEKMLKLEKSGAKYNEYEFLNKLSPEAINFLSNSQKIDSTIFSEEEIVDIVSKFTKIEDIKEIYNILDKEIENIGMDRLIQKLMNEISMVFMNAKDNSQ